VQAVLSASTIAYLFAADWAPPPDSSWKLSVPGAEVDGFATAGNLVYVAVWSLRKQGLIEVEQLRPVESEHGLLLGGRSFVRLTARGGDDRMAGIEGALLEAARDRQDQGLGARISRVGARAVDRMSGEDEFGLRGAVLALDLHSRHPWTTVAEICLAELREVGLAKFRDDDRHKPTVLNPAAFDQYRARHAELVQQRADDRTAEPELDEAISRDCDAAIRWAFTR
jgi:hypothetical protein